MPGCAPNARTEVVLFFEPFLALLKWIRVSFQAANLGSLPAGGRMTPLMSVFDLLGMIKLPRWRGMVKIFSLYLRWRRWAEPTGFSFSHPRVGYCLTKLLIHKRSSADA